MSDQHTCSYYCDRPACIARQRAELRASAVEYLETLRNVSRIAEFGGLAGMSEVDALVAIRRLTRLHADRTGTLGDQKQRAIDAIKRSADRE